MLLLALALQTPAIEPPPAPNPPAAAVAPADPASVEAYNAQVRGAFARSQSLQGPLDGAWTLKAAGGAVLYRFQLVDPGFGAGQIEGAWSDPRKAPGGASGFFTDVARDANRLILQFAPPDVGPAVATLQVRDGASFAGDLAISETGQPPRRQAVVLVRP